MKWRLLHRAINWEATLHSQQPPNYNKSEPTAVKWQVRSSTRSMRFCVVSWLLSFQVPLRILWEVPLRHKLLRCGQESPFARGSPTPECYVYGPFPLRVGKAFACCQGHSAPLGTFSAPLIPGWSKSPKQRRKQVKVDHIYLRCCFAPPSGRDLQGHF